LSSAHFKEPPVLQIPFYTDTASIFVDKDFLYPYSKRDSIKGHEMGKAQARMGRPTKKPAAGERAPLGLRVTAEIKQKLDAAAAKSGRSQSQEAELRLERSFAEERTGPEMRDLMDVIRSGFAFVAKRTATAAGHAEWTAKDWLADQDCYRAAAMHVCATLLEGLPNPSIDQLSEVLAALERKLAVQLSRTGDIEGGSGFIKPKDE
jgi:hypothetical protein